MRFFRINMFLGSLWGWQMFVDYCQCECQKHVVTMILFTGFDIFGIRIKKCQNISFLVFPNNILIFKKLLVRWD